MPNRSHTAQEKLDYHRRAGITPPPELKIRWMLEAGEMECAHQWEASSGWGVLIGISKCRKCGVTAQQSDFVRKSDAK